MRAIHLSCWDSFLNAGVNKENSPTPTCFDVNSISAPSGHPPIAWSMLLIPDVMKWVFRRDLSLPRHI